MKLINDSLLLSSTTDFENSRSYFSFSCINSSSNFCEKKILKVLMDFFFSSLFLKNCKKNKKFDFVFCFFYCRIKKITSYLMYLHVSLGKL